MIVCIAEKPSVGRDIAHVLGANQQHDGYMEGNGYQVTWTFGHLCELKEPHEYNPLWKSWSLAQLPMIPTRFGIKLKTEIAFGMYARSRNELPGSIRLYSIQKCRFRIEVLRLRCNKNSRLYGLSRQKRYGFSR